MRVAAAGGRWASEEGRGVTGAIFANGSWNAASASFLRMPLGLAGGEVKGS